MRKTSPDFIRVLFACVALFVLSSPANADEYGDARADMVVEYQSGNFAAMRRAAVRAVDARPGYAGALFNRSFAEVLDGDANASLATLNELLDQRIDLGVADIEEFAPVLKLRGWADYAHSIEQLHVPVGKARVAYSYDQGDFIPEGIALGENGDVFLGSIRNGDIVNLADAGATLVSAADGPHWSVFGMRLVGDTLWFVSSAIDEFVPLGAADKGRTGLFAVDVETGELKTRALLPESGNRQVLGDLVVASDNTLLLADQADGVIYRYAIDSGEFSELLGRGSLVSPQGLVLDASGKFLYVADYVGGLYRVALADSTVKRIDVDRSTSLYGIDGLYRHGDTLIAIQNGILPNRVARFTLSENGLTVSKGEILAMSLEEFDEPNLGEVVGDKFVFIANSHWNRFNAEGELPDDLKGPVILELDLAD